MLREGQYISVYGPGGVFRVWPKNRSLCLHHQVQSLGLVMKPGNEVAVLPATTAVVVVAQLRIGLSRPAVQVFVLPPPRPPLTAPRTGFCAHF